MAIKKCRECGKDVSTKAKKCPHCGVKRPAGGRFARAMMYCAMAFFGLMALGAIFGEPPTSSVSDGDAQSPKEAEASVADIAPPVDNKGQVLFPATNKTPPHAGCLVVYGATANDPDLWTCPLGLITPAEARAAVKLAARQKKEKAQRQREAAAKAAEKEKAQQQRETARRAKQAELDKCKQDLQCWIEHVGTIAPVRCEMAVKRRAKYAVRWTDELFEHKFDRIIWDDQDKGTLIYGGDHVQFQNGFGAWENYKYACTYDPQSGRVLGVQLVSGRF